MMGNIKGSICSCGQIHIPPERVCIACTKQNELENIELSDLGKLITYTKLNIVPDGFKAPLILGIVELDHFESDKSRIGPKLICQGKSDDFSEDELNTEMLVAVENINGLYIFRKKIMD
jgi:uncharacterized OB-fold protein